MDYERDTRCFKLRQEGKEYILSLSIVGDFLRISGQQNLEKDCEFYETDFALADLREINRYFAIMSSISEAQNELIKAIEKQKVGVELDTNILKIIFYMAIGTDKIVVKIPLDKKDKIFKKIKNPEEQEPFTGTIQLKNRGNFPEDERRIVVLEKNNENLKVSQKSLIADMQNLLDISEKLLKETNILYEENAKLNIRVQKIQKETYERNLEINALKEEGQLLNEENIQLKNYNSDLERNLEQKRELLKRSFEENKERRKLKKDDELDLGNGPKAISSRYDEAQIKTYIPRPSAKPISDAYNEGFFKSPRNQFYYTDKRMTQYLTNNNLNFERLNYTDLNINDKSRNSFKYNTNEYNINNLSYNTFNKGFDNKQLYGQDNYNSFNHLNDKDPEDNQKNKHKKTVSENQVNMPGKERISEKVNEEEDNNLVRNTDSYLEKSQSHIEGGDNIRVTESLASNYQESQSHIDNQTELEPERHLNYLNSEIIKNTTEEEMIINKINKHEKDIHFNLIYKAINDTDCAETFHQKCDKARRTLVLIETINGKRFGGFTTESWEGDGIDKVDNEAFVFSLDKMQVYNIISGQPAIGCYPKYGPVFLGCQIKVNDNFFVKGGTTYKKNTNYATNSDFELNDGIKFYGIKDIEVFEVNLI